MPPRLTDTFQWQPIETAPEGQRVSLLVANPAGDQYTLPFACIRQGATFLTEKGSAIQVEPIKWKTYAERRVAQNPRYQKPAAQAAPYPAKPRPLGD